MSTDGKQRLQSRLVPSVPVAAFDAEILSGLAIITVEKWGDYLRMQLGVRNEYGDAYRTIGVDDMNDWLRALQWFVDRGFTDELGPHRGTWKGCDAVFSRERKT